MSTVKRHWWAPASVVWLSALFLIGCEVPSFGPVDPYGPYQAEADATVALVFGVNADPSDLRPDNDDEEDVIKPGDTCKVCDGTGKVGDGRISRRCRTCGGDGVMDEQDIEKLSGEPTGQAAPDDIAQKLEELQGRIEDAAETKTPDPTIPREVTLHFNDGNYDGWPKVWWETEMPKLVAAGYSVSPDRAYGKTEPTEAYFIITVGDQTKRLEGWSTASELKRIGDEL